MARNWFRRLWAALGTKRRSRCRSSPRLCVEALEDRMMPATTFAFAVSQADRQIYLNQFDDAGPPSGTWTLTQPGQFLSVVADTFGSSGTPVAFAIGIDHQVFRARFDASGNTTGPWQLVAPGQFDLLVVDRYGFNGSPLVFGISTAATANHEVFAARFDSNANLLAGWFHFAPGPFDTLAVTRFGVSGAVELFGVNSVDHQARAARFDGLGVFIDGWFTFAPGQFQSLAATRRLNGTAELFGVGLDGQAYAANFTASGLLANGWFPVNVPQPVTFTQVVAATLGGGNLTAFGLGTDSRAYQAVFSFSNGAKISGWTPLATFPLRQVASGSQQDGLAKLYAVGLVDLQVFYEAFDANGLVLSGFAVTPSGRFTNVATAPSSAT